MATGGRELRAKCTTEVESKFIDIWADILEELGTKVYQSPGTDASCTSCKAGVQRMRHCAQPHARDDTKLKQQKNVDPEHYVRHFSFVTNYYYFNMCDRLGKHQHGGRFRRSVTIALTYTCVLMSTLSPPYFDCLISYMLPTVQCSSTCSTSLHSLISLLQ